MGLRKPAFTQISNEFIDKYMPVLSKEACLIFFAICRKTIGWHKDTDQISYTQLLKMTPISSVNGLKKAIKELKDKELINIEQSGKGKNIKTFYEINFESSDDISSHDTKDPINISSHDTKDPINISSHDTTKDSINKKKNKRYVPLSELLYNEHLKHDDKFLKSKNKENTFLLWANDIRKLIEIDKRTYEEVRQIIIWCQSEGNFWISNIMSGKKLREKFPVLISQYRTRKTKKIKVQNEYGDDVWMYEEDFVEV